MKRSKADFNCGRRIEGICPDSSDCKNVYWGEYCIRMKLSKAVRDKKMPQLGRQRLTKSGGNSGVVCPPIQERRIWNEKIL